MTLAAPASAPRRVVLPSPRRPAFLVADDKPTFWDRAEAGTWEPGTLDALDRALRPGTTLLDIGAWVGPLTLAAAALGGRVVALEPDPRAATLLRANLAANPGLAGRVTLVEAALAPAGGQGQLASPRKPGDGMGSLLPLPGAPARARVATLDPPALLARVGGGDLVLKLDVEGGEYALAEALAAAAGRFRAALVAFHPRLARGAGLGEEGVEAATRRLFDTLPGPARLLDGPPGAEPYAAALAGEVSVAFGA